MTIGSLGASRLIVIGSDLMFVSDVTKDLGCVWAQKLFADIVCGGDKAGRNGASVEQKTSNVCIQYTLHYLTFTSCPMCATHHHVILVIPQKIKLRMVIRLREIRAYQICAWFVGRVINSNIVYSFRVAFNKCYG